MQLYMNINRRQKEQIQSIGKRYMLKLMLLHGSYATGKERKGSDLDIALSGKELLEWEVFSKIFGELETVFGNTKDRELDVKSLDKADALFLYQVMKDSVLLYGSSWDYWELKTYAIRNYWDHAPIFKLEEILIKKFYA